MTLIYPVISQIKPIICSLNINFSIYCGNYKSFLMCFKSISNMEYLYFNPLFTDVYTYFNLSSYNGSFFVSTVSKYNSNSRFVILERKEVSLKHSMYFMATFCTDCHSCLFIAEYIIKFNNVIVRFF